MKFPRSTALPILPASLRLARRTTFARATPAVFALALGACSRGEPPTFVAPGVSPSIAPKGSAGASNAPVAVAPTVARTSMLDAGGSDGSVSPSPAANPDAGDEEHLARLRRRAAYDGGTLAQTHDAPVTDDAHDARVALLWDAIVADDPDRAMPFFFPLEAYEQVKDVGNPAADWKRRLVAAYKEDIHALAREIGSKRARAENVTLDVPKDRARWVEPGEEWNKIGYWRVFGSKLRFTIDGKANHVDVRSLISWRGTWFVVHLRAIK
ncbi:MAG: hypothetical protein U0169_25460 [Polyangiaceae bacterium]